MYAANSSRPVELHISPEATKRAQLQYKNSNAAVSGRRVKLRISPEATRRAQLRYKNSLQAPCDERSEDPLVRRLQAATQAFKQASIFAVRSRARKQDAVALCYNLARRFRNDQDWSLFGTLYHRRIGVRLKDSDRKRGMFYGLMYAMGENLEEARKEASRYAVEAKPYLDRNVKTREFLTDLRQKGGITGLSRLRKASRIRRNSKEDSNQPLAPTEDTVSIVINAKLIGEGRSLIAIARGKRASIEGVLTGVGKQLQFEIDRVTLL